MKKQRKPMDLIEFNKHFGTEEKCREDLFNKRFGEKLEKFVCPKCGCKKCYKITTRSVAACANCNHQVSATAGTVMQCTQLQIQKWYLAIYLITISKSGISSKSLQKEIGVTYKTAWYVHKRVCAAMKIADEKYQLEGIIAIDEAFFTGREGAKKAGRGTNKSKVLAALSLTKNNKPLFLKMKVVGNFKAKTIANFAENAIEKGAFLQTDGFRAYRSQKLKNDYLHDFEIVPASDKNSKLKWIHQMIGNAKHVILGTFHGLRKKDLQTYLDEFCYRFNRRFIPDLMFDKLINSVFSTPHI